MRNLAIKKNKRIGRVIFFVEGDEDEKELLSRIFVDIYGYSMVCFDKRNGKVLTFNKEEEPYSKVFVVPMPDSSPKHIPGNEEFLNKVFARLCEYGLQYDEAFIYYLFDRDWQSNKADNLREKLIMLKNPLDNGSVSAGALLLSYPCLQAFYCLAHGEQEDFPDNKKIKSFVKVEGRMKVGEQELLRCSSEMLSIISDLTGMSFTSDMLEDYSMFNVPVFEAEEAYAARKGDHTYKTLSLLCLALLDLGLITID